MKKISDPIVFFGSGPVAAESLRLLSEHFEIEAVITKPRALQHKGDVPVLDLATELHLPIKTAANKHELDKVFEGKPFKSHIAILIDFGIIVSQKVIDYFPLGIVNSHFSILPEWRGADPITFAILSGQKQTGVSLMLLVEAMDEGPIVAQGMYDIEPDETTNSLTAYLIELSAALLQTAVPAYIAGEMVPRSQEEVVAMLNRPFKISYSRKLVKEDGLIDWSKPAEQLEREIRAFIDWPKSRTTLGGKDVIITKAHVVPGNSTDNKPGDVELSVTKDGILMIDTGDGRLCIDRLKPAGKREMSAQEFLAGNKLY